MNIRNGILLLLVLVGLASGLAAQSFLIRTYEEQDGLISSAVNDIAQDAMGRMWFSTRNGISVYDGARWINITAANGLPTTAVLQLRPDGRGGIWAVGDNPGWQLLHFAGKTWESFAFPGDKNSPIQVTGLAVLTEAGGVRVAVGTAGGILVFDGTRWTGTDTARGLAGNTVNGIGVYEDGFLAATDGGLSFLGKNGVENRWHKIDPLLRGAIRGLAVEKTPEGEKIWITGGGWLGAIRGAAFEVLSRESPLSFSPIFPTAVMYPDLQGGVYFGNAYGVFFYDRSNQRIFPFGLREGLVAEGSTSLFVDRERNLWIGGLRGVSRLSSRRFLNFRKEQGLLEDEVTSLQLLAGGQIAFGHNIGITIWTGDRFERIPFPAEAGVDSNQSRVLDMAADPDGGLWIAAMDRGLGHWTRAGGLRWVDFGSTSGVSLTSVVVDKNKRIWASVGNGLYQILNGRPVPVFQDLFSRIFVRKLAVGPDNSLFAATGSAGLFRGNGNDWTAFTGGADSGAANVYAVYIDTKNRTLVGTVGGLFVISGDRLVRFSANDFEIRRPVYLILEDPAGRLWFGTDNGVIRWDGKRARTFSKAEGFAGREVNRSAGMIDQRGQVWIGTNSGVSKYFEEFDFGPDIIPPPIVAIDGLDVNGKAVDFSMDLTLGYRDNNLTFHFLGTSFLDESALRFQSRLDGFEDNWSPEKSEIAREIRYTNLRPGRYVFNLRARNAVGSICDPVSSPVIRIRNPFWLQGWFIAAVLLAGGGLIISLGLAVTQHRQAERLEALVLDRTAQIQAALNEKEILLKEVHHRVKNNLQIISSLLFLQSRKIKDPVTLGLFQGSITRIRAMALVHESLYRSERLTSIGMEDYLRQLVEHLIETYALRKESVKIEVRAPGIALPLETAITYGLIVNELISNSLKHAFPGDRGGTVKVLLAKVAAGEPERRKVVLTVQDDGIGIPEEMEGGRSDSLGLRLVQNLVSQMDGTVEIKRDGGTVFRIVFPE